MTAKTDTTPYNGHYKTYVAIFIIAVVLFAGSTALALSHKATGWEYTLFHSVNNWPSKWEKVMVVITMLGTTWMALASVVVAFVAKFYRLAWRLALSICGGYAVALIAKHVVGRERPFQLFTDVHQRVAETGMGFPSGHATVSTIIALTLLPYLPRKWWWILPVIVLLVCLSRLYLGVHLPLDIIGGVAVGTGTVAFIRILPQNLRVLLRID